jgi:copper chaperone CopZ
MKHTYNVAGITCSSCVAKVKSALLKVGDILSADVQVASPQATIEMQKHIPLHTLQQALKQAGDKYIITEADSGHHEMPAAETSADSYYPIFLIFGYILGVSLLVQFSNHHFDRMQWMSHFMAGFFLVFSFFKLLKLNAFAEGYSTYDVVAKHVKAYGFVYPFIELALGIAYLSGFNPLLTNLVTLIVMGVSTIGVVQSLMRNTPFQCACLGTVIQLPLSKVTLFEDLLMVAMSAIMLTAYL